MFLRENLAILWARCRSHSSTTCCLRLFTSGVAPTTNFNLRWFRCCRKILSLTLRSYFYNIRNMLFSCWSFKIVLSIFDSARAPLAISHHRWDFPHRWWTIFTFDVTSFDAMYQEFCFWFWLERSVFLSLWLKYIFLHFWHNILFLKINFNQREIIPFIS